MDKSLNHWIFDQELDFNRKILSTQVDDYTYGDLKKGVENYSHLLEFLGDFKNKRVALVMTSVYDFVTLALTVSKRGGEHCSSCSSSSSRRFKSRIGFCRSSYCFYNSRT